MAKITPAVEAEMDYSVAQIRDRHQGRRRCHRDRSLSASAPGIPSPPRFRWGYRGLELPGDPDNSS